MAQLVPFPSLICDEAQRRDEEEAPMRIFIHMHKKSGTTTSIMVVILQYSFSTFSFMT